jgi:hypothetical protein
VRVERNDEPGWGHQCPRSKIDFVVPNHPTEEQIEAFARTAGGRPREEVTDTGAFRHSAVSRTEIHIEGASGKRVERRPHVRRRPIIACDEETLDGARFTKHPLKDEHQRNEIATANPPVDDRIDVRSIATRVEAPDEAGRVRAHGRQQRLDGVQDARDAAKRECRGAEPDNLAVVRRREAPDDMNRIGGRVDVIERSIQIVEAFCEIASRIPTPEPRIPVAIAISGTA